MRTATTASARQPASSTPKKRPRRRRRLILIMAAVVVAGGAGTVVLAGTGHLSPAAPTGPTAEVPHNGAPTSLATITRRDLSARLDIQGRLDYAGRYVVVNHLTGTVTWRPPVGAQIRQGGVLYRVDDAPVVLLYGSIPAYRTLSDGVSDGRDVRELNTALTALGCDTSGQIDPTSDVFNWATAAAVKVLQARLGVPVTGQLTLGQAVFLPGAIRVASVALVPGSPAGPGQEVITGSSTRRVVQVDLPATEQGYVRRGNPVQLTLPDRTTTAGHVTDVGSVATPNDSSGPGGGSSTPTVPVQITPDAPGRTGTLDQAPVQVAITTATARQALSVPVTALLALAGGGYAVEAAPARGPHRLVAVTPRLFDDAEGLVSVTGTGLAAGMRVVVATS